MPYPRHKALEVAIRDAMDGMEALASLFAYRRLPDDLEILGIGDEAEIDYPVATPVADRTAEVVNLAEYRRLSGPRCPPAQSETTQKLG